MPDPITTAAPGAGAGLGMGGLIWLLDRMFGSGKTTKDLADALKTVAKQIEELHGWHNVQDPDDATQRIWWFSKSLRECIREMEKGVEGLQGLLGEVVQRFDQYNRMLEQLVQVVDQLQKDVERLSDDSSRRFPRSPTRP